MKYILDDKEITQAILDYISKTAMPHQGGKISVTSDIRILLEDGKVCMEVNIAEVKA